jgi:hypothetical protein
MSSGDVCSGNRNYTITYEMQCVKQDTYYFNILNKEEIDLTKCENTIKVKTTEACPKLNYYIISAFIDTHNAFLGIVVIVLGIFLLFLGAKFLKVTILIVGTLASITILFTVYYTFFTPENENSVWILLAVGGIVGISLGFLMIKFAKGVTMLIGGYLGYIVSIFIYNVLLKYIHASPQLIYWCITIGCIFVFSLLSLWIANIMLIISTSVIGGYAVVKGTSFYLEYFPSESIIVDLIKYEEFDELKNVNKY